MGFSAAAAAAINRLRSYWNGGNYSSSNQGGLGNDGHRVNFVSILQDLGLVAQETGGQADAAAASAASAQNSANTAAQVPAGNAVLSVPQTLDLSPRLQAKLNINAGSQGLIGYSASKTLDASHNGKAVFLLTAASIATLMAVAQLPVDAEVEIINASSGNISVVPQGSAVIVSAGVNYTTLNLPPGAQLKFRNDGTNWVVGTTGSQQPEGQCFFYWVSATVCRLKAFMGNQIMIGGVLRTLTTADLSASGLAANTRYLIYAYWTGSVVALLASTTAHVTDTATGMEVASGDATRSLVGQLYTNGSGQFVDSLTQRWVQSWFNDVPRPLLSAGNINTAGTSTIASASFLTWGRGAYSTVFTGYSTNPQQWTNSVFIQLDGTSVGASSNSYMASANNPMPFGPSAAGTPAEGLHTLAGVGTAGGGQTCNFNGNITGTIYG